MKQQSGSKYDEFIARLEKQLQSKHCEIWRNPQISATLEPALLATRIEWNIVRIPVHLVVDNVGRPSKDDLVKLFEEGLKFSKLVYSAGEGVPVWLSSFAMIPCIACEDLDPEIISYVNQQHLLLHQAINFWDHGYIYFPVLYSLKTNEIHYWKGFSILGGGVHPLARKFVEENIVAVAKSYSNV